MSKQLEDAFDIARSTEVDLYFQEIGIMRAIILERVNPLDMLRELISNAAAQEVRARNLWIRCYPHPEDIYVFEVEDDGIGMDYSAQPVAGRFGRLNKFLSLGLSSIVGEKSDEFSWKGLGSKMAFHSKRLEVITYTGEGPVRRVEVNAPWETITAGKKPKPTIYEVPNSTNRRPGTKVVVYGHPPDVARDYSFSQVRDYLLHRTFVGFTRDRRDPPKIHLTVGNNKETLEVGFPVLRRVSEEAGSSTRFVDLMEVATIPGTNSSLRINLKGLYSVEASRFGLAKESGNTGLILSVLGIPYFDLGLEDYTGGRRGLGLNPSQKNCCLIAECDQIQPVMNISRSAIVDSAEKEAFVHGVSNLLRRVADSEEYKSFVAYTKLDKDIRGAETLDMRKRNLGRPDQRWVYWTSPQGERRRIHREPENENDTLALLWKLEALGALPFYQFESLEHGGSGADMIVHFRENRDSNPERFLTVEAESYFSHYNIHGHNPSQMPIVICWDLSKSRKVKLKDSNVSWKFTAEVGDVGVRVFALAKMPNIEVRREVQ